MRSRRPLPQCCIYLRPPADRCPTEHPAAAALAPQPVAQQRCCPAGWTAAAGMCAAAGNPRLLGMQVGYPAAIPAVGCQLLLAVPDLAWLLDCMLMSSFELLGCCCMLDIPLLRLRCCSLVVCGGVAVVWLCRPAAEPGWQPWRGRLPAAAAASMSRVVTTCWPIQPPPDERGRQWKLGCGWGWVCVSGVCREGGGYFRCAWPGVRGDAVYCIALQCPPSGSSCTHCRWRVHPTRI